MLIFIDESGQPRPTDPSPFAVLAAIALKSEHSRDFSREIFNLKKGFKGIENPYDWEIKGNKLIGSKYITPRTREFIEELFALCRECEVVAFASIMERPKDTTLDIGIDPHIHTLYKFLMRRVNKFVLENFPERRAVFLFDSQDDRSNKRLAIRFTDFLYKTKKGWEFKNILDTPFFVNSEMTPGIQIADLFAYIINKRFQQKKKRPIEKYYQEIKGLQFEWESEEKEDLVLRGIKFIQQETKDTEETDYEKFLKEADKVQNNK